MVGRPELCRVAAGCYLARYRWGELRGDLAIGRANLSGSPPGPGVRNRCVGQCRHRADSFSCATHCGTGRMARRVWVDDSTDCPGVPVLYVLCAGRPKKSTRRTRCTVVAQCGGDDLAPHNLFALRALFCAMRRIRRILQPPSAFLPRAVPPGWYCRWFDCGFMWIGGQSHPAAWRLCGGPDWRLAGADAFTASYHRSCRGTWRSDRRYWCG